MSHVAQLEGHRKHLEAVIARADQLDRLHRNRDFQKLILDEFCVQECARLAQMSAEPNFSAEQREDALLMAQSAGHIRRWFLAVTRMADQARNDLVDLEEQLQLARVEEADIEADDADEGEDA